MAEWVGDGRPAAGGWAALNDFCGHRVYLNYVLGLRRGQAIGSGLVEGSI